MKRSTFYTLTILLLTSVFFSFTGKNEIGACYLSFTGSTGLTASKPGRLPDVVVQVRHVKSEKGDLEVTRVDGYRILFNNENNGPFVNLKVELSEENAYSQDQINLLENLKYVNAHSTGMETAELIELEFNGYKVYGSSRASIESGSTLGTFMMFPGDGVTVYFYFNNLKPGVRHFETLEEYKKLRDGFMNEYTKHLKTCKEK